MVAAIGAAAAVGGAMIQADAAGNAADTQAAATRDANGALNMANGANANRMQPWVQAGQNANSALQYYLGLGGTNPNASKSSLSGQWNNLVQGGGSGPMVNPELYAANPEYRAAWDQVVQEVQATGAGWDKGTSQAEVQSRLQSKLMDQYNAEKAQTGGSNNDSQYGSLLRQYTGQNLLNEDPGYQFRLDQGNKAINAAAAAAGRYDSGAALKALTEYGQNYASNEYQSAFNRDQTNKQSTYNMLTGQSQLGQNAAAGVGAQGAQLASQVSGNLTSNGNAQAASTLAQGNAYSNALNSMASSYASGMGGGGSTGGVNSQGMNALGTQGMIGGSSSNPWYG